jgi:hypothetical protein
VPAQQRQPGRPGQRGDRGQLLVDGGHGAELQGGVDPPLVPPEGDQRLAGGPAQPDRQPAQPQPFGGVQGVRRALRPGPDGVDQRGRLPGRLGQRQGLQRAGVGLLEAGVVGEGGGQLGQQAGPQRRGGPVAEQRQRLLAQPGDHGGDLR